MSHYKHMGHIAEYFNDTEMAVSLYDLFLASLPEDSEEDIRYYETFCQNAKIPELFQRNGHIH